jgi:ppGpp synthetase/RelA/SpoT-type nucleotidyltranferase
VPGLELAYSKSQVDLAGKIWRTWPGDRMPNAETVDQLRWALAVADHYRACHQYPLIKATNGLRSTVKTTGAPVRVSQRLKRFATMLHKLKREPTVRLSQMQDIGGCRAILPSRDHVRAVQARLEARGADRRPRVVDYVANPKDTGYRAIHVILTYDGRYIEVQLRTPAMHEWAVAVEQLGGSLGRDLKGGSGPETVQAFMRTAAEAMALDEAGEPVPDDLLARLRAQREPAVRSIQEGGT